MSDAIFPQTNTDAVLAKPDNSIPLKWGLISGLLSCILTVLAFKVVLGKSYTGFITLSFAGLIVGLVLAGVAAAEQRKAQGGYITFRQAFRPIFITLLLLIIISSIFSMIYIRYIDPTATDRMMEATVNAMSSMNMPQEQLDEMAQATEKEMQNSTKPGKMLQQFATSLVVSSLFGLIPAAIVQRKRKIQQHL